VKNVWSDHQIKAAEHAERAAMHYKRAAEYYEAGNPEKAIHHALLAIMQINYSSVHARQANEYCFKTMIDDLLEF
jgi:hypothetical protein